MTFLAATRELEAARFLVARDRHVRHRRRREQRDVQHRERGPHSSAPLPALRAAGLRVRRLQGGRSGGDLPAGLPRLSRTDARVVVLRGAHALRHRRALQW